MRLYNGVRVTNRPSSHNVRRLDMGALPLVNEMHRWGIRVDIPKLESLSRELSSLMEACEEKMRALVGRHYANPRSPKQVSELLFHKLKVQGDDPVKLSPSGSSEATDVDQLNLYKDAHPIVPLMLEWRGYATIKSTFADALPKKADSDSRIHTTLSPTTARTGRFASDSPNLQNIPARSEMGRRVRACFIPDPGWKLCAADLSQIEMRWMAHESQEPVMVNGYQDPDWDIHTQTAMDIFGLEREQVDPLEHRLPSKTVGFGTIYLIGAEGLQGQILDITGTLWPLSRCQQVLDGFYELRPYIRAWQQEQFRRARRYGMVWDAIGRTRLIPQMRSQLQWLHSEGEREAANMPIQSGATASIKLSMAMIHDKIRELETRYRTTLVRPLLQIHDEIMTEVKEEFVEEWREIQKPLMENSIPLRVPVLSSFKAADNWAELK